MGELLNEIIATLPPEYAGLLRLTAEVERLKERAGYEGEREDYDDDYENPDTYLATRLKVLESSVKVIRGALEETINQVRDLTDAITAPPDDDDTTKATPASITKPRRERLPDDANGFYCRQCGTPLTGRQKVFCGPQHSALWQHAHRGEKAQPLTKRPEVTIVAGEGVVKGSIAA